jgi:hypothetical protein
MRSLSPVPNALLSLGSLPTLDAYPGFRALVAVSVRAPIRSISFGRDDERATIPRTR